MNAHRPLRLDGGGLLLSAEPDSSFTTRSIGAAPSSANFALARRRASFAASFSRVSREISESTETRLKLAEDPLDLDIVSRGLAVVGFSGFVVVAGSVRARPGRRIACVQLEYRRPS